MGHAGVGKAWGKGLVAHFGQDIITILNSTPEVARGRLVEVPRLGPKMAAKFKAGWDTSLHRCVYQYPIFTGQYIPVLTPACQF